MGGPNRENWDLIVETARDEESVLKLLLQALVDRHGLLADITTPNRAGVLAPLREKRLLDAIRDLVAEVRVQSDSSAKAFEGHGRTLANVRLLMEILVDSSTVSGLSASSSAAVFSGSAERAPMVGWAATDCCQATC
jgi:hypothetical protein